MTKSGSNISWKNISLKMKIFISSFVTISLFMVLVFGYFIPTMKKSLIDQKKIKLEELVDTQISILRKLNDDVAGGKIVVDDAKTMAIELVKSVRFGPEGKDYIWINDFQPMMIMHPFRPDLDGKDISDYADPTGKRLFVEMAEVCKRSGQGYVEYMWQWKDDAKKIVPKISFVKTFGPWNWIVGSGLYIEDVNDEIFAITVRMIAIFAGIALLLIIVLFVVSRAISRPVEKILDFAKNLAGGDFRGRINLDQEDELGILSRALNSAADSLERLISEVLVASQNLSQAVDQIAAGNQNLSQRTSEQASSLEEIASTIEEATAAIRQNADNSSQANNLAGSTTKLAEDGNRVVVDAVASINDINKSSRKIEEILSLINEISFQTNLLALNAAVEAARAGEQGRGFAVVAGEVRNLAQRSANAAKEISILIKDSSDKIGVGTDMVNRSGEALREIVSSMKNVAGLITEIAAASQEQKQGIEQINIAISEMDSMTQQNAALVEETAAAGEEMASQAKELQAMMERFTIRENLLDSAYAEKHREIHLTAADTGKRISPAKSAEKTSRSAVPSGRAGVELKKTAGNDKTMTDVLKEEGFEEF